MKNPVSAIGGSLLLAILLCTSTQPASSRGFHHVSPLKTGTDWQARIDSVERWAHHFCDSMVSSLRGMREDLKNFTPPLDELEGKLSDLNSQLPSLRNWADSMQVQIQGRINSDSLLEGLRGRILIPDGTLRLYSVPAAPFAPEPNGLSRKYFLKIVPNGPGRIPAIHGKRTSKHIWLIEAETDPNEPDPGLE